eukprot:TRINITY_DN16722_c0_g1_i2.p1 TRINITY_DN16722_c0_g1~~TRINITY_DN16722_c0_g1_i2.p1  ORF type:complete len:482 (-),score=43.84 TRINITY_DN16722_c0_g1_i2:119-1564(-)
MNDQLAAPLLEAHTSCDKPELIRGVPLSTVIKNRRLLSKESVSGGSDIYSEPVQEFRYFISHSSGDKAWKKWVMLLVVHNLKLAMIGAACLASMASLACWQWPHLLLCNNFYLPGLGHIKLGWGHVAFNLLVGLLTRVMHWLRCSESYTFLDRACISQTDPDLRAAGIRSIGAFLKRSQTLLAFWGPDYFERLWCIYEIDVFTMIHGMDRVQILPIDMAFLWIAVFTSGVAGSLMVVLGVKLNPYMHMEFMSWINMIILACSLSAIGVSKGQQFEAYQRLRRTLSSFQVRKARCTCCDSNHRSTDGRKLLCDRVFIEEGIREWHEDKNDATDGLDVFDKLIRQEFLRFANKALGAETISFSMPLVLFCLSWTSLYVDIVIVNFTLENNIWVHLLLLLPVMWCIIFLADAMSGYLITVSNFRCPSCIRVTGAVWFNLSAVVIAMPIKLFLNVTAESLLQLACGSISFLFLTAWLRHLVAVRL